MNKFAWLISALRRAAKESGRPIPAVVAEMLKLRYSVGRMGITEYFDFRLFMNDLSTEEKQCFGGRRGQDVLDEILVDDFSKFLSLDKPTMYSLFRDAELPFPAVHALYATRRPSEAYRCLISVDELVAYLKDPANLPVYAKRSSGGFGRGNALIASVEGDDLILGDGSRIKVRAFCESLDAVNGLGWVLQEPLKADPQIAKLCGDKISGVRIHTFAAANGPQIHRAIWKINVGNNDVDNFQHGGSGNMLAQLDPDSGTVLRVVAGMQFAQTVNPVHPITHAPLHGFVLPHWNEIRELVLDAALTFPGFICPGWDVAVCADGPKLLEVNSFGDIDLSQHAFRKGFIDPQFVGFMRSRRLDAYLYGRPGRMKRSKITSRIGSRRKLHWSW